MLFAIETDFIGIDQYGEEFAGHHEQIVEADTALEVWDWFQNTWLKSYSRDTKLTDWRLSQFVPTRLSNAKASGASYFVIAEAGVWGHLEAILKFDDATWECEREIEVDPDDRPLMVPTGPFEEVV